MDITVKPSQAVGVIHRAMTNSRKPKPVFLWGPPGIGKSDIVSQIAYDVMPGNNLLIDCRLALMDPTDLRGYAWRNEATNTMEWSPPADLPSAELAAQYDNIVLFLDELNSAPPAVQAAGYQLILNRRIGQYILPDNVVIVAAGNRQGDRGVTYRMPAPLANRFRHVEMVVDFDDWMSWAINSDVHPDVIGYLTFAKQDLFAFDTKSSSEAWASPRSWVDVSDALFHPAFDSAPDYEKKAEIAGSVGDGMAAKFSEHRRVAGRLPNPDQILQGNVKTVDSDMKREISAMTALIVGLCYEINDEYKKDGITPEFNMYFNNTVRFAYDNLQPEQVILFFKTIMKDYGIRFNIRQDLEKDLYKIFSERYTKYIV
jgi:hypothetical protein